MRGSLGLLLALFVSGSLSIRVWEDGKEYLFKEEASVHVGTNDLNNTVTGFRFLSDVKVQVQADKMVVTVENIQEAHYAQSYPRNSWPYRLLTDKRELREGEREKHEWEDVQLKSKFFNSIGYENGKTFIVHLENGLAKKVELPSGLSVDGQNMMKAIASMLQVDMRDITEEDNHMWRKREMTVHGECDYEYVFTKDSTARYGEITKTTSHLRDCKNRNFRKSDMSSEKECCNLSDRDQMTGDRVFENQLFDRKYEREEDRQRRIEDEQKGIYTDKMYSPMFYPDPVNSGAMTTFLMKEEGPENFKINKIFSSGHVVISQYMTEDEMLTGERKGLTQYAWTNRTLYLKEVKALGGLDSVQNPIEQDNLEFKFKDDKVLKWNEEISVNDLKKKEAHYYSGYNRLEESQDKIIQALKNKIHMYVEEMITYHDIDGNREEVIEKLHKYNVATLLTFFRSLNYDSFITLKDYYIQLERTGDDKKYEVKRNKYEKDLFFEILPITGSWASAMAVKDIVKKNDLNDDLENAKLIRSVPFHVDGVKTLVDQYWQLIAGGAPHLEKQFTRSAIRLAYAHLVRKTCLAATIDKDLNDLDTCFKTLKIETFIQEFEQFDVKDHNLLSHYMSVFYNFKDSQVLETKLRDILYRKDIKRYPNDIRAMAVRALRYRAVKRGIEKDLFLPLFLNRNEHHEVRIAAFDAIMRGYPTTTTFTKIMMFMVYETDLEVFNYVYTAFEKFALHDNEPCEKPVHEYAKYFLTYWKTNMWMKPKYTFGLSKTYRFSFMKEKYGYSGSMDYKTIGSHRATTPLSVDIDLRTQRFNHWSNQVFGIKLRMEGIAEKIMEKVRDLLMDPKNIKFDKLKDILFNDLQIRERKDVPAKLSFFIRYRDNIVFEFHLQDSELMNRNQNIDFNKLKQMFFRIKDITAVYDLQRHFGFALNSFHYEQPTEIGVPVIFKDEAFTMVNMGGKLRKDKDWLLDTDMNLRMNNVHYTTLSIVHPDNKHEYMIKKKIVSKTVMDTGLNMEVDWHQRRVKLALKVPREELPIALIAHGRNLIETHDNKLVRSQIYLKKSCPTCLQAQVITNGKEWRRGGVMVPKYFYDLSRVYGMEMSGKYYDCELPESWSQGTYFWKMMKMFNPLNKEPKTLTSLLLSGYAQLNAFLYHYPRVESCGLRLKWAQSFDQPIDRIILHFDLRDFFMPKNIKYNEIIGDKRISLGAKLIFDGSFNRTHTMHLDMKYETEFAKTIFDFEMRRRPFVYQGRKFEDFPIRFRMETFTEDRLPLSMVRDLGMKELRSIRTNKLFQNIELTWGRPDLKIRIDGEHKTTADAKDFLRKKWYYNECIRQHELPEWRDLETIPKTDACYYAIYDLYTLQHYKWDITAANLEEWMVTMYRKTGVLIKSLLFPFWDFKPEYLRHELTPQQPRIRIESIFHPREDNFDLSLELDKEVSRFNGIKYGWWMWNEEPYMMLDKLRFLTNAKVRPQLTTYMAANRIINTCMATRQTVRTYDNVTYDFRQGMDHGCFSLLSSDCSERPNYAVFMKKDVTKAKERKELPMELLTYIGDEKIEIMPKMRKEMMLRGHDEDDHLRLNDPTQNELYSLYNKDVVKKIDFDVKINDKEFKIRDGDFLLYTRDEEPRVNNRLDKDNRLVKDYRFRMFRNIAYPNRIYIDFSPYVMIIFDGNSVQTVAGPMIKGRHCGMCGDYNVLRSFELVDPKMCVMETGEEMARAWTLDKKFCSKPVAKPECRRKLDLINMDYKQV